MSLLAEILQDSNPKAHLLNNPNLLKQIGVTEEMVKSANIKEIRKIVDKLKELRV